MKITRRDLMKGSGAAALMTPLAGIALGSTPAAPTSEKPSVFRFGVIADPQFAPAAPNKSMNRYYGNSLWKLSEAIEKLNQEELSFVIILGDLIDRYWESYQYALPLYDGLKHEHYFALGNHDFNVPQEFLGSVPRAVGLKSSYYTFQKHGYRFIVLNGNEISTYALPKDDPRWQDASRMLKDLKKEGAIYANPWNGALSDTQFAWMKAQMDEAEKAHEKVIVFNHFPVYPDHIHNELDSKRVLEAVSKAPAVVGYLCGHNHDGNYGIVNGKHFMNFKGMLDTPTETAYSIVEVHPDRMEVKGFGREENRTLKY